MASPTKQKNGKWTLQVFCGRTADGKRKYKKFTGDSREAVMMMEAEYRVQHAQCKSTAYLPFDTALALYIQIKKVVLSPSTVAGYTTQHRRLSELYPWFTSIPLGEITAQTMQMLVNTFITSEGLSPKSVKNRIGLINSVLKYNKIPVPEITLPQKVRSDRTMPTEFQIRNLIQAARGTNIEIAILLAVACGLRRSEIFALSVKDLTPDNHIHVSSAVVQDENLVYQRKAPKTYHSDRYVPVPAEIADLIREKGVICPLASPHAISDAFQKVRAKVDGLESMRFHDLRHWYASYLHSQGVPDAVVSKLGGWSRDSGVMRNVYTHALPDYEIKMHDKITKQFSRRFLA